MESELKLYLQNRWRSTLTRLSVKPSIGFRLFDEIMRQYSEKSRRYHTPDHLRFGFETLDSVFAAEDPTLGLVEAAFWYHDFVYVPVRRDNEAKSAFVAEDRLQRGLGISKEVATQVSHLIVATSHTRPPQTREATILLDTDLAILGAEPEVFDTYAKNIWLEYQGFVEYADFCYGRLKLLKEFQRKPLFWSSEMQNSVFEQRAKANIQRAIDELEAKESSCELA